MLRTLSVISPGLPLPELIAFLGPNPQHAMRVGWQPGEEGGRGAILNK